MNFVPGTNASGTAPFGAAGRSAVIAGTPTHDTRDSLLSVAGPPRRYVRGQHLFHAGNPGSAVYYVESGSVKLYGTTGNGGEQIFAFCLPGDFLGLDALGAPEYGSSAAVLEPSTLRALPVAEINRVYQRNPAVQHWIHLLLAQRIAEMYEHMMVLSKKHADERLAGFLLGLDARLSGPQRTAHSLRLSMSRYEIGCYLGLALETVSRLLRRFDDEGLAHTRARSVELHDLARLGALAGLNSSASRTSGAVRTAVGIA
ncbi:MAG: Crp/Fnr family transcriptional regulator [Gammaproteobacteria bacterium]|nr:Crp/Fnr family transcriptional regulator [Gammaproteobacteria bacterium]